MKLYEELLSRKNAGEKLDFENITRDELVQLFYFEVNTDAMIGDLFDVSSKTVRSKRYQWEIKLNLIKNEIYNKNYLREIAVSSELVEAGQMSERVGKIIFDYNSLNPEEQLALVNYLLDNNGFLYGVASDAKSYRASIRAKQKILESFRNI